VAAGASSAIEHTTSVVSTRYVIDLIADRAFFAVFSAPVDAFFGSN
jgi:hypothetical protein